MRPLAQGRTGLYRIFGDADVLLYIGISIDVSLKTRVRRHARTKPWRDEIRRNAVEWYGSWPEAKDAETKAIEDEKPRYNLAGNEWNEWNRQISTPFGLKYKRPSGVK